MYKKIIKNILLSFVVLYTILSLIGLAITEIERRKMLYDNISKIQPENRTMEVYEEMEKNAEYTISQMEGIFQREETNVPVPVTYLAMLQMTMTGIGHVLRIQIIMLSISICLSIAIGIIISLEEKSKIKHILIFILLGLILSIISALSLRVSNEDFFHTFLENFLYTIEDYGIYYILIYILVFITRYFINKNKSNR